MHTHILESEAPIQEMIPRKRLEKMETVINTCLSLIKQHFMPCLIKNCLVLLRNFVNKPVE